MDAGQPVPSLKRVGDKHCSNKERTNHSQKTSSAIYVHFPQENMFTFNPCQASQKEKHGRVRGGMLLASVYSQMYLFRSYIGICLSVVPRLCAVFCVCVCACTVLFFLRCFPLC